jgi:hypothetical protein
METKPNAEKNSVIKVVNTVLPILISDKKFAIQAALNVDFNA